MQADEIIKHITNDAFHSLKLVCDPVVSNPSAENLNNWMAVVSNINDVSFHYLWTYAVFPIQYHLCRHNTQNPILHSSSLLIMLQGLKKTFSRVSIGSVDHFIQFNKLLTEIVIENVEAVTLKELPEDVKFAVVDCLCVLNKCLSDDVVREIYNCLKKFHFLHAQSVYICTQLARNESYVNLRVVSLKCILAIIRIHGNEKNKIDSKTKANIAETVASMLPGLVSMYYFIVSSSSILHRDVYILSARVFGASVAVVFEAHHSVQTYEYLSKLQSLAVTKNANVSPSAGIQFDDWYQNTAEKLILPAKSLLSLCNNSQWKVRLEIANVAKLVLSECDNSYLMPVLSTLFEVLIVLSRDTMEEVRQVAQGTLSILLEENTLRREKFFDSFKERLFYLLTSILSALNSINENVLLSQLNLLNGYLIILSPRRIFKSSVHLENLFLTLTKVVRFDSSTVGAISENETTSLTDCNIFENPCVKKICWRNTKYLSCETESVVKSICHSIGENVDVESLTLYLLNALENQPNNRKEIVYLINHSILNAESKKYSSNRARLCKCILNTYLDSMYWSIPITLISEEENSISSASIHSNIIQICLLVEGIGNIGLCLGKEFKPLIFQSLYKMVEKAGCANEIINSTAIKSLRHVSEACNYTSITELIADNVDYLTNTITWKLRDLKHDIAVFNVFCVIISFSQENSLPILLDVLGTLLEGNNLLQDAYCDSFLRVFKSFTVKLRSWFSPVLKADKSSINESNDNYFKFLLGLKELVDRSKNKSDRFLPGTVSNDNDINLNDIFDNHLMDSVEMDAADGEPTVENVLDTMDNDEESQKVDSHIDFIVNVANNILHLLPNTNISRKAFILDILADILLILSDKENQLLPLVHKIWSPLAKRLKYDSTNPLIMRRCFQLLCIMAVISGDFIRTRTLKDILPIISGFLSSSAEDSKLKDKNSVYRTSQKYKFQLMLLSELGSLVVHINLQEKETHSILVAATPYLGSKQPRPLQDACIDLFSTIKSHNKDLVWIHLMSISPPEVRLRMQHSEYFDSIELIEPENNKDYRKNSLQLLEMDI